MPHLRKFPGRCDSCVLAVPLGAVALYEVAFFLQVAFLLWGIVYALWFVFIFSDMPSHLAMRFSVGICGVGATS